MIQDLKHGPVQTVSRVVDLTDSSKNAIYGMTVEEARSRLRDGTVQDVRAIEGNFALVTINGTTVRLARSLGRPLRYFIAKHHNGPILIVADRIDTIRAHLEREGLTDQFHPYYTRMVPAHYVTEIALLGCPDPNPTYQRFFAPTRNAFSGHADSIGPLYMRAVYDEIVKWLTHRAVEGPVGVCFSGGIDSGSVFLLTYHAFLELGLRPSRLKAFTLSVDDDSADLVQARSFLERLDLSIFLEPIQVADDEIDWRAAVDVVEDYKPLDIEAAAMTLALCRGIRRRYPEWRHLIDGDGGDENLKDYPIEENPELTIRSVLNNTMLYQEGWGVDSIKHSLTYTGGLSRSCTRTYAPTSMLGFDGLSPYTLPNVVEVAEGVPFIELTDWSHDRLYELKGRIVARGVEEVTGLRMPIFSKRRFQHGAASPSVLDKKFPAEPFAYRRAFQELYGA